MYITVFEMYVNFDAISRARSHFTSLLNLLHSLHHMYVLNRLIAIVQVLYCGFLRDVLTSHIGKGEALV